MIGSTWIRLGSVSGFIAVATGAFTAHSLEGEVEPRLIAVFKTGADYQMVHALALVLVGALVSIRGRSRGLDVAGWAFLVGTVLFAGSLYALALSGISVLGAITPIGGVGFLVGWAALAAAGPGGRIEAKNLT